LTIKLLLLQMTEPFVQYAMKRLHSCFLKNSFDCWQDIYRLQKGEVTPKRGQKRREFESDVPTRYTKGGIVYDKTVKNNDPKGWSAEGI
jgi:hypothetical protein